MAAELTPEVKYYYYSKRNCPMDALAMKLSPSLSGQNLPPRADSTVCAPDAWNNELFEVGGFYEIDHEQLLPKSPIHLKDIRVVKVTEKTRLNISVSFPSALSLRKYFTEVKVPVWSTTPAPMPQPELDEQFVMGFNQAGKILRRLIPSSDVESQVQLERFWLVDPKAHECESTAQLTAVTEEEEDEGGVNCTPVGSCLLALKSAALGGWGVRRKVKYIGRHRKESSPLVSAPKEEQGVEGSGNAGRKRPRDVGRKRKKREERRIKKLKRDRDRASDRKVFRSTKDRWSSERYEAAELKLLDIMKAKGAVLGNPVLRPELREEARKHIGDTGLLDHLLKHMAGKVVSEGSERFRRRHNAEGAMEYWLEPAELQDVRTSAGVMDPFWVPPPGWKPGDPISPYGVMCGKEIDQLKEELASLRMDIEWLRSLKLQEKEARDAQPRTDAASIIKLQESCESLEKSNAKLEEQVAAMATCLQGIQEQMRLLKLDKGKKEAERDREEKNRGVAGDDGCDDGKTNKSTAKSTRANNNAITNGSNNNNNNNNNRSESSGSRTVRRSGFRMCKPQGTFLWPSMGSGAGICTGPNPSSGSGGNGSSMMSSPSIPIPAGDGFGVPPTPHSASSTTSPPKRALPSPVSPVAAPRAQVVVVAPRLHQPQQQLVSGERTDSSDNTCSPSSHGRMRASAFTRDGGNLVNWESDGRSAGWSTISTDLALSNPCYHR